MSSRWLEMPAHVTESPGELPAGFRAAGVAAGMKPSGGLRRRAAGLLGARTASARRASRAPACSPRRSSCAKERARLDAIRVVVANSGNANAATGNRGLRGRGAHAGRGARWPAGVREDQVAVASTGVIGVPLDAGDVIKGHRRARGELREYGARRLLRGDPHHGQVRQGGRGRRRAAVRHRAADRAGQGRGDDLAGVRDDALLRPDRRGADAGDRRPAARRLRRALVRPHLGRRPALHQRHRDPAWRRARPA